VAPIYGYGWSDGAGNRRDVPEAFRLGCDGPNSQHGIVLGEHEFSGATAHLSPRHTPDTGLFDVEIRRHETAVASGYAQA